MGIILSLTPILIVLIGVIVLNKPAKFVAPIAFLAAAVLGVAYFDIDAMLILNTAWKGAIGGAKIVFVIIAAFCILNMLLETGGMDKIRELIISITDDKRMHVIIIAFGFGAFLEGCAGAGTPAAIAAPCLVGLGISPMAAVCAALISNGIAASWGGAGLTLSGGFAAMAADGAGTAYNWPLLDTMSTSEIMNMISKACSRVNAVGAVLCPWIITIVAFGRKGLKGFGKFCLVAGIAAAGSMLFTTHVLGYEFTSLIWGPFTVAVSFIYIKLAKPVTPEEFKSVMPEHKSEVSSFKALFTYGLLFIALPCARFGFEGTWIWGRGAAVWIGTTIMVVCFAGAIVLGYVKKLPKCALKSFKSVEGALIAMIFLTALAETMKVTGMLKVLATAITGVVGYGYPAAAVFIGCLGSFMTGTTLGSNMMFHPMHIEAAQILGISPGFTTAVNCSGGALGNMVCPNNVIAVCATIGFKNSEGMVMRKVFPALLVLLAAEMIAAMLYVFVFFPGYYM